MMDGALITFSKGSRAKCCRVAFTNKFASVRIRPT